MEAGTVARMDAPPDTVPEIKQEDLEFLAEVDAGLNLAQEEGTAADMARVDYFLELIQKERERVARVDAAAELRINPIQAWKQREHERAEVRIAFLELRIASYMPMTPEGFKREFGAKSVTLPAGHVGFHQKGGGIEITDEDAAIRWAEKHVPAAVKSEPKLLKTPLAQHAKQTGECEGPGWKVADKVDVFYVKPGA